MLTNKKPLFLISAVLCILTGLVWQPVSATTPSDNVQEWVNVTLWPEDDEALVRVVYEVHLSETLDFPQEVTFYLPLDFDLERVSIQRTDGDLLPLAWEINSGSDWQEVKFSAVSPVAVLEGQKPVIEEGVTFRKFSFGWRAASDVDLFSMTIYQPFGASELAVQPSLSRVEELGDGRKIYSGDYGPLTVDDEISFDFEYNKDISNPNYPALSVFPILPLDDQISGHSASPISVVIWLVAVAGVVMVLVGIYYWWISRRMRLKKEHVVRGVGILNPEKQAVFCHECGARSKAGDVYCRSCGTELHRFM